MRFEEVPKDRFAELLSGPGVCFRTGPFVTHLKTALPELADTLQLLYADHSFEDPGIWVDFRVQVRFSTKPWHIGRRHVELISDGKITSIVFQRKASMAMLEWGLNAGIYSSAHQYLIIHAAVLERNGRAVLLSGPPGIGKSTLCAALAFRGWRLLSDELSLIRPIDGRVEALARPICLKNQSIDILEQFAPEEVVFGPRMPTTAKGTVAHLRPPRDSVLRNRESAQPTRVIFPRYEQGAEASWHPLRKGATLLRLIENSFNYSLLGAQGFEILARLVEQCDGAEFRYSDLDEAIARFDELEPPLQEPLSRLTA